MSRTKILGLLVILFCCLSLSCRKSKRVSAPKLPQPAPTAVSRLTAVEWLLEDLAGRPVRDRVQSTLAFPVAGRATGSTGCNRFNGSVNINGSTIKFGALATTRRACVPASGDQERRYMKALSSAERFTVDDRTLLIYCRSFEKPLRFTLMNSTRSGSK